MGEEGCSGLRTPEQILGGRLREETRVLGAAGAGWTVTGGRSAAAGGHNTQVWEAHREQQGPTGGSLGNCAVGERPK